MHATKLQFSCYDEGGDDGNDDNKNITVIQFLLYARSDVRNLIVISSLVLFWLP